MMGGMFGGSPGMGGGDMGMMPQQDQGPETYSVSHNQQMDDIFGNKEPSIMGLAGYLIKAAFKNKVRATGQKISGFFKGGNRNDMNSNDLMWNQ